MTSTTKTGELMTFRKETIKNKKDNTKENVFVCNKCGQCFKEIPKVHYVDNEKTRCK